MTTQSEGLTLRETMTQLISPTGSPAAGEAIALATSLEVGSGPLGASSGGFVFKLDPVTGLQARTATTFGPAFAERALTSGEGKISAAVNISSSNYDRLNDLHTEQMQLGEVHANTAEISRKGFTSLVLSSTTFLFSGTVGVTDQLDMGVAVPMVKVQMNGISWVENGKGETIIRATGAGTSSGLGDLSASMKYRFYSFGSGTPDPGGLAVQGVVHLPTGDAENFRGLGVTRTLVSLIASSGTGRLRPHVNAGYEFWSKGIDVVTDFRTPRQTLTARNQIQWVAGAEYEAAPKLTLLFDALGRHTRGAGQVGFRNLTPDPNQFGVTSIDTMVALPDGVNKIVLIPGLKLNVKKSLVFSLNVLTALKDNGLHARATPVADIDLTF